MPDDARSDLKPGLGSAALATPTDNAAAPSPQPARERPVRMALDPLRGAVQDGLSSGIAQPTRTERGIAFTVPIEINRHAAGTIALRITTGDNISVRLMDILAALQPAMDPALHRALSVSKAAREYVTLNDLRAAGIAISFAADDRLMVGTK